MTRAKLARAAVALNARAGLRGVLPPLVLMTDDLSLPDPVRAARALPRGSLLILRARDDEARARLAASLHRIAHERGLLLLIAADPALAVRTGAHGLHLPEARAGEAHHWRACHPHWLITCAAHTLCAIRRAERASADAVLLSPIFPTQSHTSAVPLGTLRFRFAVRATTLPIYALGGIDARTVRRLNGAACAGIAAIGALAV